jgi:hypothetical protein
MIDREVRTCASRQRRRDEEACPRESAPLTCDPRSVRRKSADMYTAAKRYN